MLLIIWLLQPSLSTLFPYTTLFRSSCHVCEKGLTDGLAKAVGAFSKQLPRSSPTLWNIGYHHDFYWDGRSASLEKQALARSEEHTSELQSHSDLVCRLLLEKNNDNG